MNVDGEKRNVERGGTASIEGVGVIDDRELPDLLESGRGDERRQNRIQESDTKGGRMDREILDKSSSTKEGVDCVGKVGWIVFDEWGVDCVDNAGVEIVSDERESN